MTATLSPILGVDGRPIKKESHRTRDVKASFDAARYSPDFANYWANSDSLDADSAHSKAVRQNLVKRSRYEVGNNGYTDGIVQTFATDLIGVGPKLKVQAGPKGFRTAVEAVWKDWFKKTKFRRKLWAMAHAKVQDGEAFALFKNNPKINHPVKLDVSLIETEQCQTPDLNWAVEGYIDGIKFDEFDNAVWFDIMRYHPGGSWFPIRGDEYESVNAKFVAHWFLLRRPGQHRAVPEFRSTLNTGASSRRWREATVAAAEAAADMAVLLKTTLNPNEIDSVDPMSTVGFQKGMMTALPMGWDSNQMRAEHPNATYEAFNKSQINEQARPKSMPYNKAACDSSSYNYASGRLDHQTYYGGLDVEREDCNDLVLDQAFALFWYEAVYVYGWNADPDSPPEHTWDWPKHPVADVTSEASANDTNLKNGSLSLSTLYSENGYDFSEEIEKMAEDYGLTVPEMRRYLLQANLNAQNQQASITQANAQAQAQTASAGGPNAQQ